MKKFTQKAMISPLALSGGFSGGSAEEILAMAKAYCDSKGGYVEHETRQYHWDGDTSGLAVFPGELLELDVNFYRVSTDIISAVNNLDATCYRTIDDKFYKVGNVQSVEETEAILIFGTSPLGVDALHCILVKNALSEDIPAGVYFAKSDDAYTEMLYGAYTETIVPIDQKFLPNMGGGIPSIMIAEVLTDTAIEITDPNIIKVLESTEGVLQVTFRFESEGTVTSVTAVFALFDNEIEGTKTFQFTFGPYLFAIYQSEKGAPWYADAVVMA